MRPNLPSFILASEIKSRLLSVFSSSSDEAKADDQVDFSSVSTNVIDDFSRANGWATGLGVEETLILDERLISTSISVNGVAFTASASSTFDVLYKAAAYALEHAPHLSAQANAARLSHLIDALACMLWLYPNTALKAQTPIYKLMQMIRGFTVKNDLQWFVSEWMSLEAQQNNLRQLCNINPDQSIATAQVHSKLYAGNRASRTLVSYFKGVDNNPSYQLLLKNPFFRYYLGRLMLDHSLDIDGLKRLFSYSTVHLSSSTFQTVLSLIMNQTIKLDTYETALKNKKDDLLEPEQKPSPPTQSEQEQLHALFVIDPALTATIDRDAEVGPDTGTGAGTGAGAGAAVQVDAALANPVAVAVDILFYLARALPKWQQSMMAIIHKRCFSEINSTQLEGVIDDWVALDQIAYAQEPAYVPPVPSDASVVVAYQPDPFDMKWPQLCLDLVRRCHGGVSGEHRQLFYQMYRAYKSEGQTAASALQMIVDQYIEWLSIGVTDRQQAVLNKLRQRLARVRQDDPTQAKHPADQSRFYWHFMAKMSQRLLGHSTWYTPGQHPETDHALDVRGIGFSQLYTHDLLGDLVTPVVASPRFPSRAHDASMSPLTSLVIPIIREGQFCITGPDQSASPKSYVSFDWQTVNDDQGDQIKLLTPKLPEALHVKPGCASYVSCNPYRYVKLVDAWIDAVDKILRGIGRQIYMFNKAVNPNYDQTKLRFQLLSAYIKKLLPARVLSPKFGVLQAVINLFSFGLSHSKKSLKSRWIAPAFWLLAGGVDYLVVNGHWDCPGSNYPLLGLNWIASSAWILLLMTLAPGKLDPDLTSPRVIEQRMQLKSQWQDMTTRQRLAYKMRPEATVYAVGGLLTFSASFLVGMAANYYPPISEIQMCGLPFNRTPAAGLTLIAGFLFLGWIAYNAIRSIRSCCCCAQPKRSMYRLMNNLGATGMALPLPVMTNGTAQQRELK